MDTIGIKKVYSQQTDALLHQLEPVGMVNSPQRKKAKKAKFIAASIMLPSVLPKQDDPSSLFKARRISEVIGNLLFVMTQGHFFIPRKALAKRNNG